MRFAAKVAEVAAMSATPISPPSGRRFTDAQIIEIVGLVVENVFTNFVNEVAKTDIDFPVVRAAEQS